MYRLLIVDDEPIIVDGLYDLFENKTNLNLDIYKAYSARKAIEWLNRTKIGIVLTDIQMPGMNGLQLLKEIHSKWPLCKVVFLTAYSEFDYVYTAMKHNAVSYVLKSEGDQAILIAIEKCIDEINRSISTKAFIHRAKEQMHATLPLLQKEYLIDILQGGEYSCQDRENLFKKLHIPLNADFPVLLLAGRIDNYPNDALFLDKVHYLSCVDTVYQEYMANLTVSVYTMWERCKIIWFIQPNQKAIIEHENKELLWKNVMLFVKGTLETIQEVCKISLNISISFVVDDKQYLWDEIAERFYFLKQIINYQIGNVSEMVLINSEFFNSEFTQLPDSINIRNKSQLYSIKLDLLKTYLESGQRDEFFKLLTQIVIFILEVEDNSDYLGLEAYHSILLMFLSYINRWNLGFIIEDQINISNFMGTTEFITRREAVEYLYKLGEVIFSCQKNEEKNRMDVLIFTINKYISEHLNGDLSLVAISEKVFLNPAYLSRIYKQDTGINLSDYVRNMRIGQAKKLLKQDDLKIYEIAAAVGYESAAYFNRVFKKLTHMTPQEYRDSIMKNK